MADTDREGVREYDHLEFPPDCQDPFGWIDSFRDRRAHWSSKHGGFWLITRHEDYLEIIRNTEDFKSIAVITGAPTPRTPVPATQTLIPMFTDPPEQTIYRKFMGPILSPQAAKGWEGFTRETARSLVESIADEGRCEALNAFSRPLALAVFGEFMGLDQDQIQSIRDAMAQTENQAGESQEISAQAVMGMFEALGEIVDECMASTGTGDDIPRKLARAEVRGRKLTREELLAILRTLFVAGFDTTAGMLTISLRCLAMQDGVRRTIAKDPSLLPDAIEEILRLHAFVQSSRTAQVDADVAGVHIKAGDPVLLPTSMANRDPAVWDRPDEFDLHRWPNRHFGFGAGAHRCVGSHVARMELRVALEEWLRRIPEFKIPDGYVPQFHNGHVIGIQGLELEWPKPASR